MEVHHISHNFRIADLIALIRIAICVKAKIKSRSHFNLQKLVSVSDSNLDSYTDVKVAPKAVLIGLWECGFV